MLHNPNWDKPKPVPMTDPMSLDDLIAWLETKDPNQSYQFADANNCLLAQWVKHLDPEAIHVLRHDNSYVYQVHGKKVDFQSPIFARVAAHRSFGEALFDAKIYQGQR